MIKSKKIRAAARGQDCTLRLGNCSSTETVVFCHIGRRKGMGIKCSDNMGVFGCSNCHDIIDGRVRSEFNKGELNTEKLRALEETQEILMSSGLIELK
tara:strand:+ start:4373 stop:4666 length:294 start_codon:yes stop_codon:yes gene_type:complete